MFNIPVILCLTFCVLQVSSFRWNFVTPDTTKLDVYRIKREIFLNYEHSEGVGGDLKLNDKEMKANEILMHHKIREMDEGFLHPTKFPPARSFLESVDDIKKSQVFQYLKRLPKGSMLHGHDTALVSVDFIVKDLTYRDNLYAKVDGQKNLLELHFYAKAPSNEWRLVRDMRKAFGAQAFDDWLTQQLALGKDDAGLDVNTVWEKFNRLFALIKPLVTYEPVWLDHLRQTLKEFHEDNISYIEFRSSISSPYRLDGSLLNVTEACRMYIDTINDFKREHPSFVGARLIYSRARSADQRRFKDYMGIVRELKRQFPDFIAGFDLVGQEDLGNTLLYFSNELLQMQDELDFYFHAGETNWSGFSSDDNLVDTVLLGAKRMGHGYALLKHPEVARVVIDRNIGVELCPISNQVLGLVQDMRNHPGAYLLTHNFPAVITPDDPGFWGAKGASFDWYQAFMGLAAKWQDLRLLKQLALNSIEQSSLDKNQKRKFTEQWEIQWDRFIEYLNEESYESDFRNVKDGIL